MNETGCDEITLRGERFASAFNIFFLNVVRSTHEETATKLLKPPAGNNVLLNPTNESEIMYIFTTIKNSKSCDAGGLHIGFINLF